MENPIVRHSNTDCYQLWLWLYDINIYNIYIYNTYLYLLRLYKCLNLLNKTRYLVILLGM